MSARPLTELQEGESIRWNHLVTDEELSAFAQLSGDVNPLHQDDQFAQRYGFRGRVVHGMLLAAYLSRVVGTTFPGPGALWLSQTMRFLQPVYVGDTIEIAIRVIHKSESLGTLVLETSIFNQHQETVMTGEGKVMVLTQSKPVPWEQMVVLVTGASRGIGAGIAEGLAKQGARVVVNYNQGRQAADAVVSAIEAAGGKAAAVQADIATVSGATALADSALGIFGRVDVLVNNATPPILRKPFLELEWEEVDNYWRTYVQSAFTLAQRLIPGMKERQFGRFVNIVTSAIWGTPPQDLAGYVSAKSALWGLTKAMAVELAPFGITVNAISPSAVMTQQWEDMSDSRRRGLALRIPMRRLAAPNEVAQTVLFLLGEGGNYLTGVNLPVAGGEVM